MRSWFNYCPNMDWFLLKKKQNKNRTKIFRITKTQVLPGLCCIRRFEISPADSRPSMFRSEASCTSVLWGSPGCRRTGRPSARILPASRTLGASSARSLAADAPLACTHKHTQTHGRVYHTLHACMCTRNTAVVLSRGTEVMTMRWGGVNGSLAVPSAEHLVLLRRGVPDGGGDGGSAVCLHFLLAMRLFLVASMS